MKEYFLLKATKWFDKAQNKKDPWIKFILFYITYEVLYKLLNLDKYYLNNEIKERFLLEINDKNIEDLKKLLDQRPLQNMQYPEKTPIKLKNKKDFANILKFINYARNNLFHGDKELEIQRDINVIKFATKLLNTLIEVMLKYATKHRN